ncbi:UNKNOWN [Stylonychia lemnae]|uniref:Phosphoglycerate mutase family protein n=1 Tax=Stylonychia lemnae TaxID=5949 RepID=A0A078AI13_STYLE|nr:UNKNOWN [Stylonychia lemnae]|eukprot:CDW81880.1 UNKNOWN [Stylonychia lemnae]
MESQPIQRKNTTGSQIYLIRHGERADQVENNNKLIEFDHDTPLTDNGFIQAQKTGLYLRSIIAKEQEENRPFDQIIIESSPFLRCLQTAQGIASQIDICDIKVNLGYREWLSQQLFEYNPMGHLFIDQKSKAELSNEFKGLNIIIPEDYLADKDRAIVLMKFPEAMSQARERCIDQTEILIEQYRQDTEQRIMHIIISHGPLVQEFGLYNGGKNNWYLYCQVSAIELCNDGNGRKLLYDNEIFYEENEIVADEQDPIKVLEEPDSENNIRDMDEDFA